MEASSTPPKPPEEPPEVMDASTLGGFVWVVLFGLVMTLSLGANLTFMASVLRTKKKRNVVYALLILLFGVNLIEYGHLIFDFSLGLEHQYPHSPAACALYQSVSKSNAIIQAATVVLLVYYAAFHYGGLDKGRGFRPNKPSTPVLMGIFISTLVLLYGIIAVPTAFFAKIVTVEGKRYCEIEVEGGGQTMISLFYLVHCLLSFWIPLLLSIMPLVRLAKVTNSDKYPEVTVVLATVSSFFVFYSLYGCIVLLRHTMDFVGISLSPHHSWMIKVAQSLLWLVAYFWHVTRPLLALLIDADLKICSSSSASITTTYDLVEEATSSSQHHSTKKSHHLPLKVIMKDEVKEELTSLNNSSEADKLKRPGDDSKISTAAHSKIIV